jgi:uncharacterized protein (DUF488 family)
MNSTEQLSCFTIGHSNHDKEHFIGLLRQHGITCVADVRSSPYSRHNPQFNREAIKASLQSSGIGYVFLGDQLGARQTAPELLYPGSRMVCFEKVRATEAFQAGIARVITGLREGCQLALMCAEKDPFDCHRFVLVSYGLSKKGIKVRHILANGDIISNEALEEQLLASHKLHFHQPSLFEKPKTRAEALEECYDRRNRDIGYILPEARPREDEHG